MHEIEVKRMLLRLHHFTIYLAGAYLFAAMAISIGSILGIAYLVFNAHWLPAIFVLLARKDLARWLSRESSRLLANSRKGIAHSA